MTEQDESPLLSAPSEGSRHDEEALPDEAFEDVLRIRNKVLDTIKTFENNLLSAAADSSEEDEGVSSPVPEFFEEAKESLREDLYENLRHLFLDAYSTAGQLPIAVFEEAVYSSLAERLRRSLGFYQAIRRAKEAFQKCNQELGDHQALELSVKDTHRILVGLDEVDFVRRVGTSLGIFQEDLDKIVHHVITREFAPLKKE